MKEFSNDTLKTEYAGDCQEYAGALGNLTDSTPQALLDTELMVELHLLQSNSNPNMLYSRKFLETL